MPEIVLSAVHRLLDKLDKAIRKLGARKAENVDVADFPELSKFVKKRGSVPLHVARAVADRLRNYLRSQDQRSLPARLAIKRPAKK